MFLVNQGKRISKEAGRFLKVIFLNVQLRQLRREIIFIQIHGLHLRKILLPNPALNELLFSKFGIPKIMLNMATRFWKRLEI